MSYLVHPDRFEEGLKKLSGNKPLAIALSSEEWQQVPEEIRDNAFFSAQVNSAGMLSKLQKVLVDFLSQKTIDTPKGPTLRVGSRSDFVDIMQPWLIDNGFGDPLPEGSGRGTRGVNREIQDIASNRRLKLIFDTQIRRAYAYGSLKVSRDPVVEASWPAWRFVRDGFVKEPRPDHVEHDGAVRLKSDDKFWRARNNPEFGGLGVPFGPWGFNSQMGVEEVSRTESIRLGLLKEDERPPESKPIRFNEDVSASTKRWSPGILDKVKATLGDRVDVVDGIIKLKTAA